MLISDPSRHSLNRPINSFGDAATESAQCFTLSDLVDATKDFEKKVGSGGFGIVYYGKLKDGREIAAKLLINNSFQGKREFSNEASDPITKAVYVLSNKYFSNCLC